MVGIDLTESQQEAIRTAPLREWTQAADGTWVYVEQRPAWART